MGRIFEGERMNKEDKVKIIENEFYRLSQIILRQGDIDCILDLIPLKNKKQFIKDWNEGRKE